MSLFLPPEPGFRVVESSKFTRRHQGTLPKAIWSHLYRGGRTAVKLHKDIGLFKHPEGDHFREDMSEYESGMCSLGI